VEAVIDKAIDWPAPITAEARYASEDQDHRVRANPPPVRC
jgi:hypothetical protein